jgi:DNA (cytosine-5)-methyltransferase 1
LVSEKFRPFFLEWERLMARYGYTNYNKVLNAKDYGIPQNRERIFMVSIHNAEQSYYWPEPMKLEKRLKDVLEQNVDEKYYLSDLSIAKIRRNTGKEDPPVDVMGSAKTVCASLNKITTFDNYIKDV